MNLVERLERLISALPPSGSVILSRADLVGLLEEADVVPAGPEAATVEIGGPAGWRERIWTCPPETRLTAAEAAEALGRPVSWLHRRTMRVTPKERERAAKRGGRVPDRIPCHRNGRDLAFLAGELRNYIASQDGAPARTGPRAA